MPDTLRTIPRPGLDVRTVLEHTWLKRRLLAQLRENHKLWATQAADASIPGVLQGIAPRLVEARKFISSLTTAYCPSQLVRDGPLSELPADAGKIVADVLQRAFLDLNIIQPLRDEAEVSLEGVERIAETIPKVWNTPRRREEMLEALAQAAERLRAVLAALPDGVIVP